MKEKLEKYYLQVFYNIYFLDNYSNAPVKVLKLVIDRLVIAVRPPDK